MKETIGDRVVRLREARGLKPAELARLAGIPRQTLSNIETGVVDSPNIDTLEAIAAALGTTALRLRGYGPPVPDDRGTLEAVVGRLLDLVPSEIPALDLPVAGVASASPNTGVSNDDIILAEPRALAGRLRRYRIAGDCMEPDIPDGATVLVNVERQPQLGEAVLVQIGDAILCKALTGKNGAWVLRCTRGDVREVRVRPGDEMTYIGVVEHVITRPRRLIP